MEPFNYRAMLPDPSQELLKSLQIGAQLAGQVQTKTPEEMALMKERILSEQQQRRQSEAAIQASQAATAASGFGLSQARVEADRKNEIFGKLSAYANNPNATLRDVAPVLPFLSQDQREAVASTAEIRVNGRISDATKNGEVLSAQELRNFSNELSLLPTEKRLMAQKTLMSLPEGVQSAMKSTVLSSLNSAIAGNPEMAAKIAEQFAQSAGNSSDERIKQASSSFLNFANTVRANKGDPQEIAFMAINLANLTGDSVFAKGVLDSYQAHAKKATEDKPMSVSMEKQLFDSNKGVELSNNVVVDAQDVLDKAGAFFSRYGVDKKGNPKVASNEWNMDPDNFFKRIASDVSIKTGIWKDDFDRLREVLIKFQESEGLKEFKKNAPGSFSNAETRIALGNIPDIATDPKGAMEWLKAVSKTAKRASAFNQAIADWTSEFKTNASAPRDAVISGVIVKKGTPFTKFRKEFGSVVSNISDPDMLMNVTPNPPSLNRQPTQEAGKSSGDVEQILKQFGVN